MRSPKRRKRDAARRRAQDRRSRGFARLVTLSSVSHPPRDDKACPECSEPMQLVAVISDLVAEEVAWVHPHLAPGQSPDDLQWMRCHRCGELAAFSEWQPL